MKSYILAISLVVASLVGYGCPQNQKVVLSPEESLQKEIEELEFSITALKFTLAKSAIEIEQMETNFESELMKAVIEAKVMGLDPKEVGRQNIKQFRDSVQAKIMVMKIFKEILDEEERNLSFKQAQLEGIRQTEKSDSTDRHRQTQ